MILFFYGEDTYRLKQKIKELKEKYISASLGDTNLATVDGKTATYPEIVRQILAMPFLAKSRLVIIENLLLQGKKPTTVDKPTATDKGIQEQIGEFLPKVPENTFLVFVEEGIPDRRTSLFKRLSKFKTQEFKPLEPFELTKWVKNEVLKREGEIGEEEAAKLVSYIGADLWRLSNEIDKLTTYKLSSKSRHPEGVKRPKDLDSSQAQNDNDASQNDISNSITSDDIELLIKPQLEASVFTLVDEIAAKNMKKALKELHFLLENGENELYCLSMIVYQYRNLLIVKDLLERSNGRLNQWDLAKQAGLHPYVAQKTLAQAHAFTLSELKAIYKMLLDYDLSIKTGKIDPRTALDLLIIKLCL